MADFRKWLLVLAVVALVAIPASAQPFSCVTNPGQPPIIRDGGLAELVGETVLQCSGGTFGANNITTNIQIFMNPTDVTNKVKAGAVNECPTSIACVTDSILLVKDIGGNDFPAAYQPGTSVAPVTTAPIVGLLQSNLVSGDVPNTRNSILFPQLTLPQGTTTFVHILNVRVVAPPASIAGTTQVFELVSTNPVGAFPITNPNQTVAFVQPGIQFATRTCDDKGGAITTFQQCISQPTRSDDNITFNAKFTEGFAGAFKPVVQNPPTGFDRTTPGQTQLGVVYNSESGVTIPATSVGGTAWRLVGLADQGTQLLLRFTNIPAGIKIFVTNKPVAAGTSAGIDAVLVSTGATGTATLECKGVTPTYAATQVAITGGAGSATWEITSATITTQKSISFGVSVQYTADTSNGLPGLTGTTPGGVSGNFAPISTIDYATTGDPVPRFRDNPQSGQVFAVVPCVTTLLFPFVTNQGGFDTGIALVNTSLDNYASTKQPFNTPTQQGTCTVYYFDGTTTAPAPQTTVNIVKGAMVTFTLQSGGVPGSTSSAQGFQGYIIAKCNFQYGHGYAFISDRNTPSLGSQGYLALVIPDRSGTRPPDPFTTAGAGSGEQLTN